MVNSLRLDDIYGSVNLFIIGSGNDLLPAKQQVFTWNKADKLFIGSAGTWINFE